jgi:hypothetical protein
LAKTFSGESVQKTLWFQIVHDWIIIPFTFLIYIVNGGILAYLTDSIHMGQIAIVLCGAMVLMSIKTDLVKIPLGVTVSIGLVEFIFAISSKNPNGLYLAVVLLMSNTLAPLLLLGISGIYK